MTDHITPAKRSANMAQVKNGNTIPEKIVRSLLHTMGYRFRLHRKDLPGKPDIILPKHHKAIFVHGCFWHGHQGCRRSARPSSNTDFWNVKIDRNIARDAQVINALSKLGWCILILWECELRTIELVQSKLQAFLNSDKELQ